MFNQFHDISRLGVKETKAHALGNHQQTMAYANTFASKSLRAMLRDINTASFDVLINKDRALKAVPYKLDRSFGAGVGYAPLEQSLSTTEQGNGQHRYLHLVNTTPYDREEVTSLTLWDWNVDEDYIQVFDDALQPVAHQIIQRKSKIFNDSRYWSHHYTTLLIKAKVPAFGYRTYLLTELSSASVTIDNSVVIDGDIRPSSIKPKGS